MFNNTLFSKTTIAVMQPSMELLYQIARENKKVKTPAAIARVLDVTQQRLKNWEARGISKEGALKAQAIFGIDSNSLLAANVPTPHLKKYKISRDDPLPAPQLNQQTVHKIPEFWPFKRVTKDQWRQLSTSQKDLVENVIESYIKAVDPPSNTSMPAPESAIAKSA